MTQKTKTMTREGLWEAARVLRDYTDDYMISMSRAEFEAHKAAVSALSQLEIEKDIQKWAKECEGSLPNKVEDTWDDQEKARRTREERGETALDEYETARLWAISAPRYAVNLIVDEISGYHNVEVHLFHLSDSMPRGEMAKLVVLAPNRTVEDVAEWYTATAIEQTFSKAEVQQLHAYLKQKGYFRGLKIHRAWCPDNNCLGYGAYPIGSGEGWHDFYQEEDYPLQFKVAGYFDLHPYWDAEAKAKEGVPE